MRNYNIEVHPGLPEFTRMLLDKRAKLSLRRDADRQGVKGRI